MLVPESSLNPSSIAGKAVRRSHVASAAVLVSLAAHVLAAVTAGLVLPNLLHGEMHEVEVDVDLAHIALTGPPELPSDTPPAEPTDKRISPNHRASHKLTPASNTPSMNRGAPTSRAPADNPPAVATAEPAAPLRFILPAGTPGTRFASTDPDAHTQGRSEGSGEVLPGESKAFSERDVEAPARLLSSSSVPYPVEARRAEIEADVPVQILVDTQGRVLEARSLSPHGYGLDEAAAKAIRTWQFSPALHDGRPVRVRMRWTVQFRLR